VNKTMRVTGLVAALQTRQRTCQAVGIVMHKFTIDEQAAFGYLVRVSRDSNVEMEEVAVRIIGLVTDLWSALAASGRMTGPRRVCVLGEQTLPLMRTGYRVGAGSRMVRSGCRRGSPVGRRWSSAARRVRSFYDPRLRRRGALPSHGKPGWAFTV